MATNPAFDYASRDYGNIRGDLLRRAAVVAPEWTDRDPSDFGILLVDLWAYMGDIIHYYIDRASKEAFIQTATQKESVLAFANLYGYTPNYRTSSEAIVYVSNNGSASVELPANTKFVALHNDIYYYFHSSSSASLPANQLSSVVVSEGTLSEEEVLTSSSPGLPNQRYIIRDPNAVPSTIQIFVYEEGIRKQWIPYRTVSDMPVGAPGYVVELTPEGRIEIYFGDLTSGRIPASGSTITTSYVSGSGELGNIPENSIFDFESAVPDLLRVEGSTAAFGGGDGEGVESIRNALQSIIRSQDRAVTLADYRSIALTVNGVYEAVVSYEIAVPAEVNPSYNITVLYDLAASSDVPGVSLVTIHPLPYVSNYLTYSGFTIPIPPSMATEIAETVQEKAMLGVTIDVANELTIRKVNISMNVTVNKRYVNAWVKADIENVLDSFFTFQSVMFGKEIGMGELYKAVFDVEGVDNCVITVLEMRDASNNLIPTGTLGETQLIKKGTYTISATGGMSTSV